MMPMMRSNVPNPPMSFVLKVTLFTGLPPLKSRAVYSLLTNRRSSCVDGPSDPAQPHATLIGEAFELFSDFWKSRTLERQQQSRSNYWTIWIRIRAIGIVDQLEVLNES